MTSTTKIDVSTRASVVKYLRSIHVNPKGVVIQRGLRNYAGAHCPGKGWTCASTGHAVVQIAKRGGHNRFVCKSSRCVVVQISGTSHGVYASGRRFAATGAPNKGGSSGVCLKNGSGSPTGSGQSCTITQAGSGPNMAVVWQNSQKMAGLTTSLNYTALITQQATGGLSTQGNTACVTQYINLDGSTTGLKGKPVTVTLEAHQSVTISQDASGSGPNTATNASVLSGTTAVCDTSNTLGQNQTLTSTANGTAGITQLENAGQIACPDGRSPVDYFNMCLDVEQNQSAGFLNSSSVSGANSAAFVQTNSLTAIANTPNGPVTQTQGSLDGGLVGTVNQYSTGRSTASATQNETQCEDASKTAGLTSCDVNDADASEAPTPLTQTQYGPAGVGNLKKLHRDPHRRQFFKTLKGLGASIQTGNPNNVFTISQTSTQDNDQGGGTQQNFVQGDCSTSGSCTAGQTATLNGSPTSDGYTSPTITNLTIKCPTGQPSCQGTPPPVPTILTHPNMTTDARGATFTFNDAPATSGFTFKCSIDGGSYNACSSGGTNATFSSLSTGSHTFRVEAVDTTPTHNVSLPASFTWTIVDANISLSPSSATNEVGTTHTVTCTINQDTGDGNGFVAAPDGTTCSGSVLAGGPNVGSIGFCTTTGGTCTITYTDTGGTGTDTVHATTTFSVGGVSMTRSTQASGPADVHNDGLDVSKTWVDAYITISPLTASPTAGANEVLTISVYTNGSGSGYAPAGGVLVTASLPTDTASSTFVGGDTCTTASSGAGTGTCTVTITSPTTGQTTVNASFSNLLVSGVSLSRSTNDGKSSDSPDALITWQ